MMTHAVHLEADKSVEIQGIEHINSLHAVYPRPDSISDGMSKLEINRALVVGVTTDILFPPRQQREIADVMQATGTEVEYVEIDSVNGHDAFLIDDAHFSPVVKKFLDESVA